MRLLYAACLVAGLSGPALAQGATAQDGTSAAGTAHAASPEAQAYAETLSVDDLKAVLAFYETKAGRDLIKAQPMLAQLRIRGMTAWMVEIQPEMQTRMAEIMKKHGWDKDPD